MLRARPSATIMLLLAPWAIAAYCEDGPETPEEGPRYWMAATEAIGSNVVIHLVDRFVLRADYAQTSWSSISRNLGSEWVFDHDSFSVNEIAHPYHGSLYFNSGRSNGLNFWESTACAAMGSATWELFGENELPSINDIVSTTMGGAVLGEMTHRIFLEAERASSPLRVVASPMDALTEAVLGGEPEGAKPPHVPSELAFSLRAGMSFPDLDMSETRGVSSGFAEPLGQITESLVYGDPFGGASSAPFSHFEERVRLGYSASTYELSFFSNGSLCSFSLVDEPRRKLSVGADIHYDFIFSSMVDLSANAVGLSLAAARRLEGDATLSVEAYLNAVAMGTSDNVFLMKRAEAAGADADIRNYDFGFGEGTKLYVLAAHPRLGSLSLECEAYGLHAFPNSLEEASDFDYALVGVLELAYERKVAAHLSLGTAYLLYDKFAFYDNGVDLHESLQSITLFVRII